MKINLMIQILNSFCVKITGKDENRQKIIKEVAGFMKPMMDYYKRAKMEEMGEMSGDDKKRKSGDDKKRKSGDDKKPKSGEDKKPKSGDDKKPKSGDDMSDSEKIRSNEQKRMLIHEYLELLWKQELEERRKKI